MIIEILRANPTTIGYEINFKEACAHYANFECEHRQTVTERAAKV